MEEQKRLLAHAGEYLLFPNVLWHLDLEPEERLIVDGWVGVLHPQPIGGHDFRVAVVPAEVLDHEEVTLHHLKQRTW